MTDVRSMRRACHKLLSCVPFLQVLAKTYVDPPRKWLQRVWCDRDYWGRKKKYNKNSATEPLSGLDNQLALHPVITPSLQKLGWLGAAGVVVNAKHNERLLYNYSLSLWVSGGHFVATGFSMARCLSMVCCKQPRKCRSCRFETCFAKCGFVFRGIGYRSPWFSFEESLEVPECANVFFFLGGCGEKNGTNHLEASNIVPVRFVMLWWS